MKTILILGGYGGVGSVLAKYLLKETNVKLIIAGRQKEKADSFANELNGKFKGTRVLGVYADASNQESMEMAFKKVNLVINATTATQFIPLVARAAINSKSDYLELSVHYTLGEMRPEINKAKRCFITQAGFHPGLPAVFVRFASKYFTQFDKAIISMAMNAHFKHPSSASEVADMVGGDPAEILVDGEWVEGTYKRMKKIYFEGFGTKSCYPIQMEEIMILPKMYGLKDIGVYAAGFNWFIDNFVLPLNMLLYKIKKGFGKKLLSWLMYWGARMFTPPSPKILFILDAEGMKKNTKVRLRLAAEHHNAFDFTAIPVVACIKQYLKGNYKSGLHMMGHIVDPKRLFKDMEKMGVTISEKKR